MLVVNGWTPNEENVIFDGRFMTTNSNYTYRIVSEQFTILDEKDFEYFDSKKNNSQSEDSTLHFCYYSGFESSFSLNIYFLSKVENVQAQSKANILTPSHKIRE